MVPGPVQDLALVSVRHVLLIANPASRRGGREVTRAVAAFRKAGVDVDAVLTERPGHAAVIAQELAALSDAVFTLGGDGTAMEVLEVVSALGRPVGVLPGGTGNLMARALGTPLRIPRAVQALLGGAERRIDLGLLGDGRSFGFAAGVGIDATMLQHASARLKRRFGMLAYVTAGTRAALQLDSFELRATVDGRHHTFHATAALVANFGTVLGGLLQLGPGIDPSDGWLNLCVYEPRSMRDALNIGWRIGRRRFDGALRMHFLKGQTIRLETIPARPAQADGELLGMTPMDCRVRPLAARLLVPHSLLP
ncbi:MAG: diacylglycerol/lipid kinase family protein [Gemmatimonadaceae bacterium]